MNNEEVTLKSNSEQVTELATFIHQHLERYLGLSACDFTELPKRQQEALLFVAENILIRQETPEGDLL